MRIIKLIQVSYAGATLTDFDLPKTIGYYASESLAWIARENHVREREGHGDDSTTLDDYNTEYLEVQE